MTDLEQLAKLPFSAFLRAQWNRLALRWLVLARGIAAGAFWVAVLSGLAWLDHFGLRLVGAILLALWAFLSVPAIVLQLVVITDVLLLAMIGKIVAYPAILAAIREQLAAETATGPNVTARGDRIMNAVLFVADATCPTSALSIWCFIVLCRAPESKHVQTRRETRREIRLQVQRERELVDLVMARARHRMALTP